VIIGASQITILLGEGFYLCKFSRVEDLRPVQQLLFIKRRQLSLDFGLFPGGSGYRAIIAKQIENRSTTETK
jgi:hypothetical protein